MKTNLDVIDELYAELNALKPLKAEDQNRLDKKFRLEFNYNSNHIEGNTLTYGETELLLMFDDTLGKHSLREYEETKAHDVAFHMIEEWAKDSDRPLTEQNIKNLNEIILVRPYWKEAITVDNQKTRRKIKVGDYKEHPNSVRLQNGEMFDYASPTDTPILMQELIQWYRDEEPGLHPLTLATMLHYKFVRIHPFDDGNGRISRLLMNYVLLKYNYPPVIIKSSDKDNYLRVLHIADIGNYEPLIDYVSEQLIWSLKTSIKAAKGEDLEDKDDFIKEIELIKRKASSKGIPKSPKIIFETFKLIDNKIWKPILDTLKHFDALFNESRNMYSVNNQHQNTLISSIRNAVTDFDKLMIFGHNVHENDVYTIGWQHHMLALRGADEPLNLGVFLQVNFSNYKYTLELKIYNNDLFKIVKAYQEDFLASDIEEINTIVKKHLLEFINNKVD